VRLGTTIASLRQTADGVVAEFPDGTQASYDFVVGCDGIHSAVRRLAFDHVPEAAFTGLAGGRAATPRPQDRDCMRVFYGSITKAGVSPHSGDEMFLFLVQPIRDDRRPPPDTMHTVLREQLADFSGDTMEYVREHVTDPRKVDFRPMNAFLLPLPWHNGRIV